MTHSDLTPPPDDASSHGTFSVADTALDQLDALVDGDLQTLTPGRRQLMRGLRCLRDGQLEEALALLRRASRKAPSPLDDVARVATAECHRIAGRTQAAIRGWQSILDADDAPPAVICMAGLSLAAIAEDRGDAELLRRARRAVRSRCSKVLSPRS